MSIEEHELFYDAERQKRRHVIGAVCYLFLFLMFAAGAVGFIATAQGFAYYLEDGSGFDEIKASPTSMLNANPLLIFAGGAFTAAAIFALLGAIYSSRFVKALRALDDLESGELSRSHSLK